MWWRWHLGLEQTEVYQLRCAAAAAAAVVVVVVVVVIEALAAVAVEGIAVGLAVVVEQKQGRHNRVLVQARKIVVVVERKEIAVVH